MTTSTYTGTRLFFLHLGNHPNKTESRGAIKTCLPSGQDLHTIVSDLGTHPDGIAVDSSRSHIYYSNMGTDPAGRDGFISRVDIDGKNNTVIVPVPEAAGSAYTPKQLIIVPVEGAQSPGKLYWCDREGGRVWSSEMDGTNTECLYIAGPRVEDTKEDETNHCVGVAVNPKRGLLLWTQKGPSKGGKGRLFCAGINIPKGESPESRSDVKILMENLPEPIDLELDEGPHLLYKTDRGAPPRGNTVSRLHLDKDGKVVEEVLVQHLHDAIGIALDKKTKKMYFTDIGGSVYEADFDGGNKKAILDDQGDLTGIWCVNFD